MKFSKRANGSDNGQRGEILPMALVLLAAVIFVIVPSLFAAQVALGVDRDTEKDSRGYYAAEAGIADAVWKFKTYPGTAPFTPTSSIGSSYNLSNTVNGLTVQVSLLKYSYTNTNNYFIQSSALAGAAKQASIIALITQTGSAGNDVFDQAAVSLGGDITLSGGCTITSDNTTPKGDIYANGNVYVNPSAHVYGTASATGSVNVNTGGGATVGVSKPGAAAYLPQTIDINSYITQAKGTGSQHNPSIPNYGTVSIGPAYFDGDVSIGGSVTVNLTGPIYVAGKLTIGAGATVQGPYTIVANQIVVSGGSGVQLAKGSIPFMIATSSNTINSNPAFLVSGSAQISAVVYAPNGKAYISGGVGSNGYNVYGSVVAKSIELAGSTSIKYLTGIRLMSQIPGPGTGGTASLMRYDYR
jgi:cytoskeletal protein CcmA (bactofilin family)